MNFEGMLFMVGFLFGAFMFFFFNVHYVFLLLLIEMMLLFLFGLFGVYGVGFLGLGSLFVFILVVVCMGGYSISVVLYLARYLGRDFWSMGYIF